MCDLRFAAAGAKFTTAFARRGLIAEYGMSWVAAPPGRHGQRARPADLRPGVPRRGGQGDRHGQRGRPAPSSCWTTTLHYAADLAANSSPTSMAVMKRQVYADSDRSLQEASDGAIALMQASLQAPRLRRGRAELPGQAPAELRPRPQGRLTGPGSLDSRPPPMGRAAAKTCASVSARTRIESAGVGAGGGRILSRRVRPHHRCRRRQGGPAGPARPRPPTSSSG